MEELWKDIPNYEGRYQVSNTGKLRSFCKSREGKIMKLNISRGYVWVRLFDQAKKSKNFLVHRIVAMAFVPNPYGYKEINHKDENKENNNADNLEWCSRAYNMSYGTARFRQGLSSSQAVEQITMENIPIALYYSVSVAARINNLDSSSILKCCRNKRTYVGGYRWRFYESTDQ